MINSHQPHWRHNNTTPPPVNMKEICEAFELTYAADADDPASAADLFHFTNGWKACIMSQVRAPVADEKCKRCGGHGWRTDHTTGYPHSIPCSACNPQGVSVERLAKDPFLAAQLWRKPVADGAALASAPVADERAAILRDLAQHASEVSDHTPSSFNAGVIRLANRASAALASAPVANDVTPAGMKEICPECGHQFGCFHSPYIDKLRAKASAPVSGEALF